MAGGGTVKRQHNHDKWGLRHHCELRAGQGKGERNEVFILTDDWKETRRWWNLMMAPGGHERPERTPDPLSGDLPSWERLLR
jgi:hypothetical protein